MEVHLETEEIGSYIKYNTIFRKYFIYLSFLIIAIFFTSCSESATTAAPAMEEAVPAMEAAAPSAEEAPIPELTKTLDTVKKKSIESKGLQPNQFDKYLVVLAADENMTLPGLPGELRIWIGNPSYRPDIPDEMVKANTTVPAIGGWAKIEPHAKAFKIEPSITPCVEIAPSGSEIPFKLIPLKTGSFKVGASVWLFKSPNCEDSPVPKIATDLYVTVNVDRKEDFREKIKELGTIFWEQLLEFWKAFLILLFGLILFLIRGRLKRWFGYETN